LLDEAPHDLTHAFNVGGSDQPSPLLPSLLRPAMVVNLHPCSLRDHDTGETLCISVIEHTIIVRCGEPRTIYVVYAALRSKIRQKTVAG
jgi:hypothetical protein